MRSAYAARGPSAERKRPLFLFYPALIPQRARAPRKRTGYFHSSRLCGTRFLGGSPSSWRVLLVILDGIRAVAQRRPPRLLSDPHVAPPTGLVIIVAPSFPRASAPGLVWFAPPGLGFQEDRRAAIHSLFVLSAGHKSPLFHHFALDSNTILLLTLRRTNGIVLPSSKRGAACAEGSLKI